MKTIDIILCEHCEKAYYCRILNPYKCDDNFTQAINSNFNIEILENVAKKIELIESNYSTFY